ncbi:hypothetical protein K402DRAFT_421346, partial [Aulographum hederae CBS 113979]
MDFSQQQPQPRSASAASSEPAVNTMATPPPASFLTLPRELRDVIYDELFSNSLWGPGVIRIHFGGDDKTTKRLRAMEPLPTSILRVNHQVSAEACASLFQRHTFSFLCTPRKIEQFLERLPARNRRLVSQVRMTAFTASTA